MSNQWDEDTPIAKVKSRDTIKANIQDCNNTIKANLLNLRVATTEEYGIVRLATVEEAILGEINTAVVINPYTLHEVLSNFGGTYIYEQAIASDTWTIEHNLEKFPACTVVDSAGTMQMPDEITYIDENQMILQFISPFAGYAYLN